MVMREREKRKEQVQEVTKELMEANCEREVLFQKKEKKNLKSKIYCLS